jgi:hypothetical protein
MTEIMQSGGPAFRTLAPRAEGWRGPPPNESAILYLPADLI